MIRRVAAIIGQWGRQQFQSLHQSYFQKSNVDLLRPLESLVTLFKITCLWITRQSSWKRIILSIFVRIVLQDSILVFQLMYLPNARSIVEVIAIMSFLTSYISTFFEMAILYWNTGSITSLIGSIRRCIDDFGVTDKFYERIATIEKISRTVVGFVLCSLMATLVSNFVFHKLPVIMWLPLDIQDPLNFWLIFVHQNASFIFCSPIIILLQFLPSYFMVYICGLLEELCERLERVTAQSERTTSQAEHDGIRRQLVKCINFHNQIHEMSTKIRHMFAFPFLIRGTLTCILICTSIFSLITISDAPTTTQLTTYIVYVCGQLFIPCYYGNKITEVSSRISLSVAYSHWMITDRDYRQLVLVVLEFAKKPMQISAFGLFAVNLENYGWMCRSAYSLFTVFKRMNEK